MPKPMTPSAPPNILPWTDSVQPIIELWSCFSFPFVRSTVRVSIANIPFALAPPA